MGLGVEAEKQRKRTRRWAWACSGERVEEGKGEGEGEGEVRQGDVLTLHVTNLAFAGSQRGGGGSGVARTEDGLVVFVEGGLPGSTVEATVTRMERSHAIATVKATVQESPHAKDPGCKHWNEGCGGCAYLNMDYASQLPFKKAHVADVLQKVGGFSDFKMTGPGEAPSSTRYRNNMQYRIWQQPAQKGRYGNVQREAGPMTVGLNSKGAYDRVLDIDDCLLPSEASLKAYKAAKELVLSCGLTTERENGGLESILVRSSGEGADEKVMVSIVTRARAAEFLLKMVQPLRDACPEVASVLNVFPSDGGMGDVMATRAEILPKSKGRNRGGAVRGGKKKIGGRPSARGSSWKSTFMDEKQEDGAGAMGEYVALYGDPWLEHQIRGLRFKISSRAFFQTNTAQTEDLYSAAESLVRRGKHETVADLYCGSGTIGLCIAKHTDAKLVVGIEKNPDSVADARENARLNEIDNCVFTCGDVPKLLAQMTKKVSSSPLPCSMATQCLHPLSRSMAKQCLHPLSWRLVESPVRPSQ